MPLPNEHSCRLQSPSKYDEWARENCKVKHDGKCIDFIYGIKDGKSELQAMRYKKSIWTEDSAKNHCKKKGGEFHPAGKEKSKNLLGGEEMTELKHYENLEFDIPIIVKRCYTVKKKDKEEPDWVIEGYASMTGADRNEPIIEISKEAMKNSENDLLKNSTVFLEHDRLVRVGKVLESKMDKVGLWVKILISKTAKTIWQQIKEGVLNGLSIGARILESAKRMNKEIGKLVELVTKMEIVEVSLVGLPAHPDTKIVSYKEEALMPVCNYIYKSLQKHKIEDIDKEGGEKDMSKKESEKKEKGLVEIVQEATAGFEISAEQVEAIAKSLEENEIEKMLKDDVVSKLKQKLTDDINEALSGSKKEEEPVVEEPVVEEPVVEEPVVEKPVVEKPVVEKPVVEEPVVEEPVVEKPVVEKPVVEEPVVEEPVVEKPVVEEPVVEEPVVEEPVVEKPVVEKPTEGKEVEKALRAEVDVKFGKYTEILDGLKKSLDDISKKTMTSEQVEEVVKKVIKSLPEPTELKKSIEVQEEDDKDTEKNLHPREKLTKHIRERLNKKKE